MRANQRPSTIPTTVFALSVDVHQIGSTETTSDNEQPSEYFRTIVTSRRGLMRSGKQNQLEKRCKDGEDVLNIEQLRVHLQSHQTEPKIIDLASNSERLRL
jgi:hypothetical protein